MKNKENLNIDYSRHVEYLSKTKAVLTKRLEDRFGKEEVPPGLQMKARTTGKRGKQR